ncbi:MAG: hypothetical protein AABX47_06105 [Nanoarchaeota archaeon]
MDKRFILTMTFVLIMLMTASAASAMYYYNTNPYGNQNYYQNHWYRNGWNMWSQYPGGTFWSPQPVASTPLYSYYNTDYYGYNPSPTYNYPTDSYPVYNYPTYNNTNNYCPTQYYDGSRYGQTSYYYDCRGRIAYPQGSQPTSYSYYHNDPYATGYNSNYPNYLSYGWS